MSDALADVRDHTEPAFTLFAETLCCVAGRITLEAAMPGRSTEVSRDHPERESSRIDTASQIE
jgi:hypothetical protein